MVVFHLKQSETRLKEIWKFPICTAPDLQDEVIGPIIRKEYRKDVSKRMKNDKKNMDILGFYNISIFRDFECYPRREIDLVEDDIRLVLDERKSSFITLDLEPGIHTFKALSEVPYKLLPPKYVVFNNSFDIDADDITMKTKLVVKPGVIAIKFEEILFFSTILGLAPHWDCTHYNENNSPKIINLSTTNKIHLKCDAIDGSIVNALRQPMPFSFVLDRPSGYKVISEPETIHYKKNNLF